MAVTTTGWTEYTKIKLKIILKYSVFKNWTLKSAIQANGLYCHLYYWMFDCIGYCKKCENLTLFCFQCQMSKFHQVLKVEGYSSLWVTHCAISSPPMWKSTSVEVTPTTTLLIRSVHGSEQNWMCWSQTEQGNLKLSNIVIVQGCFHKCIVVFEIKKLSLPPFLICSRVCKTGTYKSKILKLVMKGLTKHLLHMITCLCKTKSQING